MTQHDMLTANNAVIKVEMMTFREDLQPNIRNVVSLRMDVHYRFVFQTFDNFESPFFELPPVECSNT